MPYFFKNKRTGKLFRVLSIDKDAGTVTLKGAFHEFVEPLTQERMKALGYELVQQDDDTLPAEETEASPDETSYDPEEGEYE